MAAGDPEPLNGTNGHAAQTKGTEGGESRPVGSYPPTGIHVLIVGTGLAGLSASIECIRKGHTVTVLERAATINTSGDMYFMGLSATRFFKHWPEMSAEYDAISLHDCWMETYKHSGEKMIPAKLVAERLKAQGLDPKTPPGTFQMRPLVYQMFVHQLQRLGVEVKHNQRVVEYEEDADKGKAYAITDDGTRYEADIVIAADGVGSKSQKLVGGQVRAQSSGRAMWRAAFPIAALDQNPRVRDFFKLVGPDDSQPIVRTWLGPTTYGLTLTRPDTMIWIINHDTTGSEEENWNHTIDKQEVLDNMDKGMGPVGWAPIFKELVACTPDDTIVNFGLLWRNPQPSWKSPGRRVVQIGDAAHSFLPASSNGATQAIEDAVSIASCLQIGGKEKIPESVGAHVLFRFVRTSCAQKLGFSNAELFQDTKWDQVQMNPRKAQPKLPAWVFMHDPEPYAYENYDLAVKAIKDGATYATDVKELKPNYPPGYEYEPWNIDQIMSAVKEKGEFGLGKGDWE